MTTAETTMRHSKISFAGSVLDMPRSQYMATRSDSLSAKAEASFAASVAAAFGSLSESDLVDAFERQTLAQANEPVLRALCGHMTRFIHAHGLFAPLVETLPAVLSEEDLFGSSRRRSTTYALVDEAQQPKTVARADNWSDSDDEDVITVINQYRVTDRFVGSGASGTVMKVVNDEDEVFAAKQVSRPAGQKLRRNLSASDENATSHTNTASELQREVAIMKKLRHPNIVTLHEVIEDEAEQQVFLIMQYVEGGAIGQVDAHGRCNSKIEPAALLKHLEGLCSGLRYLHKNNIYHCDLKPENILVDGTGCVYLADFGKSVLFDAGAGGASVGTPAFMAPELIEADADTPVSPATADIWALGVTLYALLFGELPFFHETYGGLCERILHWELRFPRGAEDSDVAEMRTLVELIRGMLIKNPAKRHALSRIRRRVTCCGSLSISNSCSFVSQMGPLSPTGSRVAFSPLPSHGSTRTDSLFALGASALGGVLPEDEGSPDVKPLALVVSFDDMEHAVGHIGDCAPASVKSRHDALED